MNENLYSDGPTSRAQYSGFESGRQNHKSAILQLMAVVMLKMGERNLTITQQDLDKLLYETLAVEEHQDGSFSIQIRPKVYRFSNACTTLLQNCLTLLNTVRYTED